MFWYYQPIGPSATFLIRLFQINIQFIVFTTLGSSPIYQHLYLAIRIYILVEIY